MKRRILRNSVICIAFLVVCVICLFSCQSKAKSEPDLAQSMNTLENILLSMDTVSSDNYKKYISLYEAEKYMGETIVFSQTQRDEADRTVTPDETMIIELDVEKAGLYVLGVDYKCVGDNILQTSIAMKCNGEYPYEELKHLFFSDTWETGKKQYDRYGNESISMPGRVSEWKFTYLRDTSFLQNEPLMLYLNEGINILEFEANEGSIVLGDVYLGTLKEVSADATEIAEGTQWIEIQAEDFVTRNSPNIRTQASFNTSVTPYNPELKIQNIIDESSYRIGGTDVDYVFEVKEDGYYYFAFDYMQSTKSNFTVYRNLYIDGEIPSASYENIDFAYTTKYQRNEVRVPIYLTKGMHELTLEVSIEPYGDAIAILDSLVEQVNDMALSLNKITGGNTNKYRDFELEQYGLNIEEKLNSWADTVQQVYNALAAGDRCGKSNGEIKLLDAAAKNLQELAAKPNQLPQNINRFSYGDSSVRQYLTNVSENLSYGNLSLDKILVYQKDADLPKAKNIFEKVSMRVKHFIASFTQDDYAPGYEDTETLEIWVNRPRQYLEIMQRMADTDFVEKTGIKVNLSIVPDQQKLILSNASGKAPDVAIGIASSYVYDLALRNALVDMRQFDNFKEVGNRFAPGMLIPGICDEGVYAIPETFNFYVMFYRTDVFEKLNLEVPDNMDEVREMLPELNRLGLGFNTHVANLVTKTFAATAPFIFQNNGTIFGEDTTKCQLDTEEVIGGLRYLTENFTIYDMDYEVLNFYQSFRDGRMPIGVSDYATYNLLTNAAPELNGCWDIALYPGLVREDGTVERFTSGAAESCIIFSSSNQQDAAWQFVDWWMSDSVQTEFSFTLQATLGNEYMWNSANLNAIAAAPWSAEHKEVIMEQISWSNEMPKVPGSYMIERELGNVLISVVTENVNIRTAIDNAQKRINAELTRKLEEFGYIDSEGNEIKELVVPDVELVREWLK